MLNLSIPQVRIIIFGLLIAPQIYDGKYELELEIIFLYHISYWGENMALLNQL